MTNALKPEAQGNVAVEPVADLIARLTYRVNNPSAWDSFDDGASELIREAASSIASLSERLAAVITRLWPNGFGPQNLEELAVFIEEERRCDTEYRDELRAKLAEANRREENLRTVLTIPDADRRLWFISDMLGRHGCLNRSDICSAFGVSIPQASNDIKRWIDAHPGAIEYDKSGKRYVSTVRARAFRDATSGAKS